MKKLILLAVVCLASCGPSAEKIKEDADAKQLAKYTDSLDAVVGKELGISTKSISELGVDTSAIK